MAPSRSIVVAALGFVLAACGIAVAADATPRPLLPVVAFINTNTPPPTRAQALQGGNQSAAVAASGDLSGVGAAAIATGTQTTTPTPPSKTVSRSATVKELTNQVFTRANVAAAEQSAALGQVISVGGSVRTLDNSKARIDLTEGTIVRLAPLTSFTVSALNKDAVNPLTQLQLLFGKIWIILKGGTLDVQTPVGVASVRGSFMSVAYNAALQQTIITCLEGLCNVLFNNVELPMTDAEQITIPFPGRVGGIDPFEILDWLANNPESEAVVPTNTPTLLPPPATATNTPVPPNPATASKTPTATITRTPTVTATQTPTATVTQTPTATATVTQTPTATSTPPTSLVVDSVADAVDASPGDGVCATAINECTLRAAIMEANALTGSQTITFSAATNGTPITLALVGTDNTAAAGDLDITDTLTLTGNGAANTIIDGNGGAIGDRVFHVNPGPPYTLTVSISAVTIKNGKPGGPGGGIFSNGNFSLSDSTVSNNLAAEGAGIYADGTLTLTNVSINSNGDAGTLKGGGLVKNGGTGTLTDVTIDRNQAGGSSANGGGLLANGAMTLSRVTISNNSATGAGGGIHNAATITLTNSTISGNTAIGNGGGIFNGGTLNLTDSTVSNNQAMDGGGVCNNSNATLTRVTLDGNLAKNNGGGAINVSTMTVVDSTVSGNTANSDSSGSGDGGGLYQAAGTLTVSGSTISGNTGNGGGGMWSGSTSNVTNSTFSGNTAANGPGGGLDVSAATATFNNVTIANNTVSVGGLGAGVHVFAGGAASAQLKNSLLGNNGPGDNCSGTVTSLGYNLSSDASCGFGSTGDANGIDPLLDPLGSYGGPTQTVRLQAGSPAIDTADNASCEATDQRGITRPVDGDATPGAVCDKGAYEAP